MDKDPLDDEWLASKIEAFEKLCSPGVTFTDKQKEMIQERISKTNISIHTCSLSRRDRIKRWIIKIIERYRSC